MRQQEGCLRSSPGNWSLKRTAALAEAKAANSVVYYLRRVSDGMIKIGSLHVAAYG